MMAALLSLSVGWVGVAHAQQGSAPVAGRAQEFVQRRGSAGQGSAAALHKARVQSAAMPRAATANLTAAWQPMGPSSVASATYGNLTGRVTALAPDPNDATGNTLYVGTTGGGVWKSANAAGALAAATFVPLTDSQAPLSIGAVAVQPQANGVVLAGTGDPNDATDSYYGEGILRSANGGLTWTLITESHDGVNGNHSFAGLATAGLAFSTVTPTLVVAAMSTSPQSTAVDAPNAASVAGLYVSGDGGQTWQMATLYDGSTVVQQAQPLGTGQVGNAATSVVWDAARQRFYAAVRGHGYYSSADGMTWTRLTAQPGTSLTTANCPVGLNGVGSTSCPVFRGSLAVQPATGDLYALTVDANGADQGLWQDLCAANSGACATPAPTFANRLDNGVLDVTGTSTILQGTYNLALAAAGTAGGGTLLFAGTVDVYRCVLGAEASSCTWRNTTNTLDGCNAPAGVAPAQHALAAVTPASGTPLLYAGNDGGLWRSLDGVAQSGAVCAASDKTHFDNLNAALGAGGSLAEVVGFAQHPTDPDTLLAGLGANGSAATSSASSLAAWPQLSAGEGGFPQLDPNTPADWYLSTGAGVSVSACTLGAGCAAANFVPPATVGSTQVDGDVALLDAPNLLDPADTANLLVGTCRVWRGVAASGSTWAGGNAISGAFNGSAVPCTAASPLIRSLAAGGPAQSSTSAQLAGSTVVYAGLAGTQDGGSNLAGHLFVTKTANVAFTASSWTDAALSPVTNDVADAHVFNPAGFDVSSVDADGHDATGATVYATVMGFGYPHVYRSTDFGAHWLNISANLPDAPANAVVVDPNDANTVYVGLDTGVYVTQAVTTCATANCWSVLGTGLPNAPVLSLAAAAGIPAGTGSKGMLRAGTYGRGLWQTPLLTATSTAQPALALLVTSLSFGNQQVSTQSVAQTVTLTSSGNAPVTVSSIVATGDFTETDNCTGQTLAVNATCTVSVFFTPSVTGARTGTLTVYADIPTGQATVGLSGTGTAAPAIVLTPTALTFAAVTVNQADAPQIITVANTGGTPATLQSVTVGGANAADFAVSANTCSSPIAASFACSVQITFTPSAAGARSASLTVVDSAGTQTATLSGTGTAPATDTLSPLSLTFAAQQVSTQSAPQAVTLTNNGGVALTLIAASVTTPSGAADFAVVNACGNSLAANSSCALNVTFTPTATGVRTGTLTVSDQFRSQTVTLSGSGLAPAGVSLSPAALSFAATGVTLTSASQGVTLTNNGGEPLTITSATVSAGFQMVATTCANTLAAAAACTYTVVFTPTAAGPASGTLTLVTSAPAPTQSVALSGTGVDFTLAASGPTSATLASGASATYALTLSSLAGLQGTVALACSGAPTSSTCTVSPSSGTLGTTVPVTVTVATATTVAGLPLRDEARGRGVAWALLLPALSLLPLRRTRRRMGRRVLAGCLLPALVALSGCVTTRIVPPPTGTTQGTVATPSGSYTLTVSASAAGLTRSVPLTLTVQ